MIVRSRVVVPMVGEPIENAAVAIAGNQIAGVGRFEEVRARHGGEVLDLGEQILLPGLINAHCHLDYTATAILQRLDLGDQCAQSGFSGRGLPDRNRRRSCRGPGIWNDDPRQSGGLSGVAPAPAAVAAAHLVVCGDDRR